jgi:ketosteroid isomerase-like protein
MAQQEDRQDFDTPKADFWRLRDGKIVEFYELFRHRAGHGGGDVSRQRPW